ncbi:DUF350 domain-containing protein [Ferrimonas lipolytica]|uniref:DUF350 domain-containing protein n=1 Tax=Ferrimonas lipolytica TaxID=2724191 RepID=A0A6H1UF70_9GAMM|nr:DUF350 domain-containing protein [Ferrimonas lipolytica]QIZ77745.1 hypothetical protein HER31_13060 [Ferrimonas lipolytica]
MEGILPLSLLPSAEHLLLQGIDLVLVLLLFVAARYSHGWFSGVDSTSELAERDNVAFGISVAGGVVALAIALSEVFMLPLVNQPILHGLRLLALGIGSLLMIRLGRWSYDKWGLHRFDKRELILEGNIAMALVDGAVACAIAMVLKGSMVWFDGLHWGTVPMLLVNFIAALTLLVLISRVLEWRFSRHNQGGSLQQALAQGHMPVAIRHGGYLLACGLLMHSSGLSSIFSPNEPVSNLAIWFSLSVCKILLLIIFSSLLRYLVLAKVKVNEEIELQNNGGVAALEGALVFASAYLISHLF